MKQLDSEAFYISFDAKHPSLNTDMQIVFFDYLQFRLVFWSVRVNGNVILVQRVQIFNMSCEFSFTSILCQVSFLGRRQCSVIQKNV